MHPDGLSLSSCPLSITVLNLPTNHNPLNPLFSNNTTNHTSTCLPGNIPVCHLVLFWQRLIPFRSNCNSCACANDCNSCGCGSCNVRLPYLRESTSLTDMLLSIALSMCRILSSNSDHGLELVNYRAQENESIDAVEVLKRLVFGGDAYWPVFEFRAECC